MIAEETVRPRRARRATIAGLVLTALAAATGAATAGPASATANGREMGVRIWSMPTTAAHHVNSASQSSTTTVRTAAAAASLVWIDVVSVVGGARVRAMPINGAVLRLIPYGGRASALCWVPANDGYAWTWVYYAGIKGYVRNDLITPVQYTYPGAPPYRAVPKC